MNNKSIFSAAILIFFFASIRATAQEKIERKQLLEAQIGAQTVSSVDVREIIFKPSQKTGLHRHPCAVISYLAEGTIRFQIKGQQLQTLHAGQVCYEPANTVIEHFDNASDQAPAKFVAYYLLNGQKELIEMLPEKASGY
ncbi:MAG: cupin domain-containing protein [Chthoniobacterales bacterium]|nr:cupin domain-containing protein [Chthoniobacterales bacterium]